MTIMFNEICINEEILPKYIYIYIYNTHIHYQDKIKFKLFTSFFTELLNSKVIFSIIYIWPSAIFL